MNEQPTQVTTKAGKGVLRIALFLFLLFFGNLLIGKGNIAFKWGLPHLGSVAEFLLLGAASTVLIWAALIREAAEDEISNINLKED